MVNVKSLAALISVLSITACYPTQNPETAQPVKTTTVRIANNSYYPPRIQVTTGQTVTWVNEDSVVHNVTSNHFNSGNILPGQRYSYRFQQPGKYTYESDAYSNMQGIVDVY